MVEGVLRPGDLMVWELLSLPGLALLFIGFVAALRWMARPPEDYDGD